MQKRKNIFSQSTETDQYIQQASLNVNIIYLQPFRKLDNDFFKECPHPKVKEQIFLSKYFETSLKTTVS